LKERPLSTRKHRRPLVRAAVAAFATLAGWGIASAQTTTLVHCGTLLQTAGKAPKKQATLVVRDGDVVEIRDGFVTAAQYGERDAEVIDLAEMFVMPGMIDCHVHLTGEMSPDARLRSVQNSDADAALNGVVYARRTLDAGFTTVRDVGASGDAIFALRDAINAGKVVGPRILAAGEAITPTGGHGDGTHGYREDLFDYPTPFVGVADGPYEARKAVRHQVKRGADVIKLTATGGVLSATAAGTDQQFFEDELEAIVDTAHSLGRKVAAHAHGVDGIKAALRAGVDSIEHGSFLDDEAIVLFKEKGAYLVPTVFAGETVTILAGQDGYFVPAVRAKALAVGPVMLGALGKAHRAGVKIAFGTDCGVGPHGQNARELELMVQAGMPPEAVLRSATVVAAELCGLGDQVGTLEQGKAADFIAVRGSPLEDISVLRSVTVVARDGVVVKDAR
jgi:imidazolonepropionase-like amidohydrolase